MSSAVDSSLTFHRLLTTFSAPAWRKVRVSTGSRSPAAMIRRRSECGCRSCRC